MPALKARPLSEPDEGRVVGCFELDCEETDMPEELVFNVDEECRFD